MFTSNPINGADERVIEANWGLGEAVVSGRVIPDHFRVARSGEVLDRTPGVKKLAIRSLPDGGTVDEDVRPELVERMCLDDGQLEQLNALAAQCEQIYGPGRDIEWAFADGDLFLLQCRAMTHVARSRTRAEAQETADETSDESAETEAQPATAPAGTIARVALFADLDPRELEQIARLFKERRFVAGETVAKEGSGGAALFVIASGEVAVSIHGTPRGTLGPGDYFGEIALIDEGARTATITATTDLVCHGLTLWDFRPLVQSNAMIAWKLLESLAKRFRADQDWSSSLRSE
jgi:hypothetical protein